LSESELGEGSLEGSLEQELGAGAWSMSLEGSFKQ
jgi:hypothetical protein